MTDNLKDPLSKKASALSHKIGVKAARKIKAQQNRSATVWQGLGMMGLIGWSISLPTLMGVALGLWLDNNVPGQRSWTLTFLVAGLMIGCFTAWQWIAKENMAIHNEKERNHE